METSTRPDPCRSPGVFGFAQPSVFVEPKTIEHGPKGVLGGH